MALQIVTVRHTDDPHEEPRTFLMDDHLGPKGEEIRSGHSRLQSLRRQAQRGELHSVTVEPADGQPVKAPRKAAKASAEAAE